MEKPDERHAKMQAFIKHRERVLEAKSVVQCRQRTKSLPPSRSAQKKNEKRRIEAENERLLTALLKISQRKRSTY